MRKLKTAKQAVACAVAVAMLTGNVMGIHDLKAYGAVNGTYGSITVSPGNATVVDAVDVPSSVSLADENADSSAAALYAYLKGVGESPYVLYGHQNDTHHKGGGSFEGSSTSDTKDLTGSIAAIWGIDSLSLTGSELGIPEGESDSVDEAVALSLDAASQGAIVTLSAHMPNFRNIKEKGKNLDGTYNYNEYSSNDTSGDVVSGLLPGGDLNDVYTGFLDIIARYGAALQEKGVPVLFRPLHENNGSWFWWGAAYCDEEAYKNLYRYTVEYLKNNKGIHNFLYVYSPNGPFDGIGDYESRYPGDRYVDLVGFDMYHDNPQASDGWMASFEDTIRLVEQVAERHGKIPTVAETGMRVTTSLGDGKNYGGIAPFGNRRLNWFNEIEGIVSASKAPYFLVWANFDAVDNFFTPYKVDAVHGHEMADNFIRFYNDETTVFADGTNFYGQMSAPAVQAGSTSGYILYPSSGSRVLKTTTVRASLSERSEDVKFVLTNEDRSVSIPLDAQETAGTRGSGHTFTAKITSNHLAQLGKSVGNLELLVDGQSMSTIQLLYGIDEETTSSLNVDQFETYLGKTLLLMKEWATNSGTGCGVNPELTSEYKSEGDYGMAFRYTLSTAGGEGWAGMTRAMKADWSANNAVQLWIKPDGRGQKLVIQLTSNGEDFEVYLPEFAATTEARYVTIPFAAMKGKNGGTFDASSISSFGIWCNTIGNANFDSVMYFDDIHTVVTDQAEVSFGEGRLEAKDTVQNTAQEEKTERVPVDPKYMHLGPGYVPAKEAEAPAAIPVVTELYKEADGAKYESTDVSWLMTSAPTDYVTVEYVCDDPEKAGWGVLGWNATVDGNWKEGPSYITDKANPTAKQKVMVSIQALRRNFGIKEGSKAERVGLEPWNGGRLLSMTLTQGVSIPRNPILMENAAPNQSWECMDIEYIRDLPDNKIISLTGTCADQAHSEWEIMKWGAQVNGKWVEGPIYYATKPARLKFQISFTAAEFRRMFGMTDDAKVSALSLSVYNGGQILRLAIDDAKQPSYGYDIGGGARRESDPDKKETYRSPNLSRYQELIRKAEDDEEMVVDCGLSGAIDAWGWLEDVSGADAVSMLKPGSYVVIKYRADDGKSAPRLWPVIAGEENAYKYTVSCMWSNGEYAVFSYDSIASQLKNHLVPGEIKSLSLSGGSSPVRVEYVKVVADSSTEVVDESRRITEQWGQYWLQLADYNAEYETGDTVTVTVTLDKKAGGYLGANIGGTWDQGDELGGTVFVRTLQPDEGKVAVSIGKFYGASYVEIKDVRVDIAGKVNYNAAVEINAPQNLAVTGTDPKQLAEAAGMSAEEINNGTRLVVTVAEEELTDELLAKIGDAKPEGAAQTPTAIAAVDISVMKVYADGSEKAVTNTADPLEFVLAVPEGTDTSKSFVVARIHNGVFDGWLEDLDDNPDTITIRSDRFSQYVISAIDLVTDEEIAERAVLQTGNLSRVNRVIEKAGRGEEVTIAFLGGSITNGSVAEPKETSCYAYLTYEWWKENFPNTKINYVNAGIGATDSYLGVHRVADDVLAKNPDLVMVEFCVNDYRGHNQESYESLIRRILQYRTNPAVVGLFLTHYSDGSCPDYSEEHQEIAEYYDIPVISYRDVVRDRLLEGSLKWTDIGPADDTTHPNNAGHKLISRCTRYFFDQVLADTDKNYGDYSAYKMKQEPVTDSRFENGRILDNRSADGISLKCDDYKKVTIEGAQFPYGWQTDTGKDMTFTINDSTNLGLIYYGGQSGDYGIFDVYVDGKYSNTIDTNFYGSWGSHADYVLLKTPGTTGQHTVRITKNENSTGDIFTILGFTVSSTDKAPTKDYIDVFTREELDHEKETTGNNWISHEYVISDYLESPAVIGSDTIRVEVTLEGDGEYYGAFGISDRITETSDRWYSAPYHGTGGSEETFSFIATPMWDNFQIQLYDGGTAAQSVKVKSIAVTKAERTETDPTAAIVSDAEIAAKAVLQTGNLSRVREVMQKAEDGEEVTIAFLGGSITNGSVAEPKEENCYANLTAEWWRKNFPDAAINYVNAGIGATDSYLGVHRVAADVLEENPDLVVVEYCVNDYRSHNQETYESLIRRILQSDTSPAVVGLFLTHYGDGSCPDWSSYHKEIAEYYDIPVVSYRDVVRGRLLDGSLKWTDIGPETDTTHPNNAGHRIISRCMTYFFDQVLADMDNQSYGDYTPYEMPVDPKTLSRYENGEILDHNSEDGIQVSGEDVSEVTISEAQFPYGWQTDTGKDILFTVDSATNIGLIYYGGQSDDYGTFDVYVDDEFTKTIDTNFSGSWGSHADYVILATGIPAGSHVVRITKNAGSTGDIFTILGLTVSSSDAEEPDYVDVIYRTELEEAAAGGQNWVSHTYTLSDYLQDAVTVNRDTVEIEVTFESEGDYTGCLGVANVDPSGEEEWGIWQNIPYEGTFTETFRATPRTDSFMLTFYSMEADRVVVKDITVTRAEAEENAIHTFTEPWKGYETRMGEYNADFEAGKETTVTVTLDKRATVYIGGNEDESWSSGDALTGTEVTRTFVPSDDYLNVSLGDLNGHAEVKLLSIEVTQQTATAFSLWEEGFEHGFVKEEDEDGPWTERFAITDYMPEFEAGEGTALTIRVRFESDSSYEGYLEWERGLASPSNAVATGSNWNQAKSRIQGDEIQDDEYEAILTGVPNDDEFKICITRIDGTYVAISSIEIDYAAEEDEEEDDEEDTKALKTKAVSPAAEVPEKTDLEKEKSDEATDEGESVKKEE